jgi:hypothetical protein
VRGEKILLTSIVFVENLLGLFVLSSFVERRDYLIAICYALGSAFGALFASYCTKSTQTT